MCGHCSVSKQFFDKQLKIGNLIDILDVVDIKLCNNQVIFR